MKRKTHILELVRNSLREAERPDEEIDRVMNEISSADADGSFLSSACAQLAVDSLTDQFISVGLKSDSEPTPLGIDLEEAIDFVRSLSCEARNTN